MPDALESRPFASYTHAVDPYSRDRVFVTDGVSVTRTKDGGCSWTTVFSLTPEYTNDPAITRDAYTIDSIVIPSSALAHDRVYLLLRGTPDGQTPTDPRARVFVSEDAGASWRALATATLVGYPLRLWVAPSDPDVLYLATASDATGFDHGMVLYASTNGGTSWTIRSMRPHTGDVDLFADGVITLRGMCAVETACVGIDYHAVAIDPLDPNSLWAGTASYSNAAIYHSTDGGRTWSPVFAFAGFPGVQRIDVRHEPGSLARIAAFVVTTADRGTRQAVFWSTDGGETWTLRYLPWEWSTDVESLASGDTQEDLVAVAAPAPSVDGVAYRNRGRTWERLTPPRVGGRIPVLFDVAADRSAKPSFSFLGGYQKDGGHVVLIRLRPAAPGIPPLAPCSSVRRSAGWERVPTPIRVGTRGAGGYAVDPLDPRRLFVADPFTVARSLDGGCTWTQVLGLPVVPLGRYPFDPRTTFIAGIAVPEVGATNRIVYLALYQIDPTGARHPYVLVTHDDGATWKLAAAGLPPIGEPRQLVVSPSDPDVMYLTLQVGDATLVQTVEDEDLAVSPVASLLYASTDAGTTWVPRHISGSVSGRVNVPFEAPPGFIRVLVLDPLEPETLWVSSASGQVLRSKDGGRTWRLELSDEGVAGLDVSTLAVHHREGEKPSVLALDATAGTVWTSDDPDGGRWTPSHNGGLQTQWTWSTSAAFGADRDSALVGTFKGVFKKVPLSARDLCLRMSERPPKSYCDALARLYGRFVTWDPVSPDAVVLDVTSDRTRNPTFYGRAYEEAAFMRYRPSSDLSQSLRLLLNGLCKDCRPSEGSARLMPDGIDVRIPAGSSRAVPYELTIPGAPIDVYFLVDTSVSMSGNNLAMQRRMVEMIAAMRETGADVWFGVGEYRTYTCDASLQTRNFPYRRDRDISPPDAALIDTLARLEGHGHSGAALTALYQAATGAGQDVAPPGRSRSDVEPALQANFRPHSLRVIVNITDRYFNAPGRETGGDTDEACTLATWPGPTFGEAIRALQAKGIHQVGLVGYDGSEIKSAGQVQGAPATAFGDLRRVAAATNTFAPAGGVDCDGDGRSELSAGEPLVCPIPGGLQEDNGERMAASMVHAIGALPVLESVRFSEATASGVVSEIAPGSYTNVDLNGRTRLGLTVTYRCGLLPGTYPVRLAAQVSNGVEASAGARVHCGTTQSLLPPVVPRPGLGLAPVPIAQPPLQVPGPQPGQEPQPQGQPEAHSALAAEQQEQPQTALVLVTQAIQEQQTEFAFSSRRTRDPYGAAKLPLGLAAAALTAAFGWLSLARARVQTRRVRR